MTRLASAMSSAAEVRVDGRHEQSIAQHPEPAVDRTAAENHLVGQIAPIPPDLPPRSRVDQALLLNPVMITPSITIGVASKLPSAPV